MTHFRTTLLGCLTIAAAVISAATALLQGHSVDITATITAITAGFGLIKAADGANVK